MSDDHEIELELRIGGQLARIGVRLPRAPIALADFLPIARGLTDLTVQVASQEAAQLGRPVRCGPRCGACCRQLVPIAPAEALALRAVVASLPSESKTRVTERFVQARATLAAQGLLPRLLPNEASNADTAESRRRLGLDYFALGIPCPFLEAESCSIHPHRPLACREYLVASDPARCAQPSAETVAVVEIPRRLSVLLAKLGAESVPGQPVWLPLVLALDDDCFDAPAVAAPIHPALQLFERLLALLASPPTPDSSGDGDQPRPGLC